MTFQSPIYLLALLAVPASVAIYLFADRRRQAGAAHFASPQLMPSVAPAGPGFRRHLPLLYEEVRSDLPKKLAAYGEAEIASRFPNSCPYSLDQELGDLWPGTDVTGRVRPSA